ncbi:MAG: hypothetical protein OXU51_16800 [Candidatus Poribacteria bacterium]|nr:hypothetical protein [Candidatus Poribacteria bacterium]
MSKTQRTLFNPRADGLWIAGAFVLLLIVVVVRILSSSPSPAAPVNESAVETVPRRVQQPSPVFDSESFYRTIIDNNLFRPLGWTPPRPVEPYQLLGTILPTDEKIPPQAIIQVSTAGNKTHIVSIGDTLDADTKIVDIQPKQVVLDRTGQQITLKLDTSPWISTSKGRFSRRR